PGEQQYYTFSGVAGQRLYYDALDADFDRISARLESRRGWMWFLTWGNSDYDVGPFTLLETGAYTLIIDGAGDTVGNYSFRLLDLAAASTLTLGTTINGQLDIRTETDLYVFNGAAGQRVTLDIISASASEA